MSKPQIAAFQDHLSDFTASPRLLLLAGMAGVAGLGGTVAAFVLLKLIALVTNLAYYQHGFDRDAGLSRPICRSGPSPFLWRAA